MAGSNGNGRLTPTEQRFMALFADQRLHHWEELRDLLDDELGEIVNVQMHISNIRRKIRPRGEDIICHVVDRRTCYCHVRLTPNPYRG